MTDGDEPDGLRERALAAADTLALTPGQTAPMAVPGAVALAAADDVTLARGTTLGRYILLEPLGRGAMGVVYAAYDPELDRKVALKLLRGDQGGADDASFGHTRLLREAQAMARLAHENVITVYDVGSFGARVFVAMELVQGTTLTAFVKELSARPPLRWREIVDVFVRAGRGLAAAHAAELVHRDFKPDNVLVGADGRVRVLDFGLARDAAATLVDPTATAATSARVSSSTPLDTALTRTGVIMGTPAYMAPEQFAGQPASPRSDQFSFCVALFEALYGVRPFPGETLGELTRQIAAGTIHEPAHPPRLPARLRRAIRKGLSLGAEQRYPTMLALLADLSRAARGTRRWVVAGAAAVVVVAAAGIVVGSAARTPRVAVVAPPLCAGAADRLAGAWDPTVKASVGQAFRATRKPFAEAAFAGVAARLDAYATGWTTMHTETCAATRLRGEQSEDLLDLRMACLEERRRDLGALAQVLAAADAGVVEQALGAADGLRRLDDCADVAALTARTPPPRDAAARQAVDDLRPRLAEIRALEEAGQYARALALAGPAAQAAVAIGYRPIMADALWLRASLEEALTQPAAAAASYYDAADAAEAAREDALAVRVWTRLVALVGATQTDPKLAAHWARRARAGIDRLGGGGGGGGGGDGSGVHADPRVRELEALLAASLGDVAAAQGEYAVARGHLEQALALWEALRGPDHPDVARALGALGTLVGQHGEYAAALAYERRAEEILVAAMGPDHPRVADASARVGFALMLAGDLGGARAAEERALAVYRRVYGDADLHVAEAIRNLGIVAQEAGAYDEALGHFQQALALCEALGAPAHKSTARLYSNIASVLTAQGKFAEAVEWTNKNIAILEELYGRDHVELATPLLGLGDALLALGRAREALAVYERILALDEKAYGTAYDYLAYELCGIGEARLLLGDTARALLALERAHTLYAARTDDAIELARIQFALARALWQAGRDRPRARALAAAAEQLYVGAGENGTTGKDRVAAWRASHR